MKMIKLMAIALATAALGACGGGGDGRNGGDTLASTAPAPSTPADAFTTATAQQVAASSDASEPIAVDSLALTQSDSGEPVAVW